MSDKSLQNWVVIQGKHDESYTKVTSEVRFGKMPEIEEKQPEKQLRCSVELGLSVDE